MRQWSLILLMLITVNGKAQGNKEVLLHMAKTGNSISDFIPKGYDTLGIATGDLNNDGRKDLAIVLYNLHEESNGQDYDTNAVSNINRILIILFKTKLGWNLVGRSGSLILCNNCGGTNAINGYPIDPFSDIKIQNGTLIISENGGLEKWGITLRFKFLKDDFYLVGKTNISESKHWCEKLKKYQEETITINFLTGERKKRQISDDCKELADIDDKIEVKPLIKLADFNVDSNN